MEVSQSNQQSILSGKVYNFIKDELLCEQKLSDFIQGIYNFDTNSIMELDTQKYSCEKESNCTANLTKIKEHLRFLKKDQCIGIRIINLFDFLEYLNNKSKFFMFEQDYRYKQTSNINLIITGNYHSCYDFLSKRICQMLYKRYEENKLFKGLTNEQCKKLKTKLQGLYEKIEIENQEKERKKKQEEERKRKQKEELERKKKQEEERKRKQEEEERKKKELERKRKQEEEERKRKEELERKRKEEEKIINDFLAKTGIGSEKYENIYSDNEKNYNFIYTLGYYYNEILQQSLAKEEEIEKFRKLFLKHYLNNNNDQECEVFRQGMEVRKQEEEIINDFLAKIGIGNEKNYNSIYTLGYYYNDILQQGLAVEEIEQFRTFFAKHYLDNNSDKEYEVLLQGMKAREQEEKRRIEEKKKKTRRRKTKKTRRRKTKTRRRKTKKTRRRKKKKRRRRKRRKKFF